MKLAAMTEMPEFPIRGNEVSFTAKVTVALQIF
jgi:hypothetical protein